MNNIFVWRTPEPTSWDFDETDFTLGSWAQLDLSAIIPSDAVRVLLNVRFEDASIDKDVAFREKGQSAGIQVYQCRNKLANKWEFFNPSIPVGSDGIIECYGSAGIDHIDVVVIGWFIDECENIYFCSSESEINSALSDIGLNGGTIIIDTGRYELDNTIDIDGGGRYIIQGQGDKTIIDCKTDKRAFSVTSATSCILRDFKIDATDLTTTWREVIYINESSDNKVKIENVTITGDGTNGKAIEINSDGCIVKNCYITDCDRGIELLNSNYNTVLGNYVKDSNSWGILVNTSHYNTILGNITYNNNECGIGLSYSDNNAVSGNTCISNNKNGMLILQSDNNTVIGNACNNNDSNTANAQAGIYIEMDSTNNTITGNTCNNNNNSGAGNGFGIYIEDANSDENTVTGNTCQGNDTMAGWDNGTNTFYQTATDNDPLNNFQ